MTQAMDPATVGLTPDQIANLMEMFITDMHLRVVEGGFWMDVLPMCVKGIQLCERIKTEGRLSRTPNLPEGVVKTMAGAIEVSIQEIRSLRTELMGKLALLKQCPSPGAKIH